MHVFIKLMKGCVRYPSLVKMQRFDLITEQLFEHFHVIDHPIIGTLGQSQNPWIFIFGLTSKWIGFDFALYAFRPEFIQRDRPYNSQMISGGPQENGDGTRHGDGVQNRFRSEERRVGKGGRIRVGGGEAEEMVAGEWVGRRSG